ncbi:hypothetical protein H4S00_002593 [Coemansia sp. D1744]|nr:hypothetical protein H4S00_002593 [Coemansia sp. D1744]
MRDSRYAALALRRSHAQLLVHSSSGTQLLVRGSRYTALMRVSRYAALAVCGTRVQNLVCCMLAHIADIAPASHAPVGSTHDTRNTWSSKGRMILALTHASVLNEANRLAVN